MSASSVVEDIAFGKDGPSPTVLRIATVFHGALSVEDEESVDFAYGKCKSDPSSAYVTIRSRYSSFAPALRVPDLPPSWAYKQNGTEEPQVRVQDVCNPYWDIPKPTVRFCYVPSELEECDEVLSSSDASMPDLFDSDADSEAPISPKATGSFSYMPETSAPAFTRGKRKTSELEASSWLPASAYPPRAKVAMHSYPMPDEALAIASAFGDAAEFQ